MPAKGGADDRRRGRRRIAGQKVQIARCRKVSTANPAGASAASKAATVSGEAGSAVRPCAAHHSVNRAIDAR
jgi:hypothetical protein